MPGLTSCFGTRCNRPPFCKRHPVYQRIFTFSLFAVLSAAILISPVLAHSAAQMGVAPDQYDQGIPIYWPYHALLMSAGFVFFLSGIIVMRFRKSPDKFRFHALLQTAGGGSIMAGLSVGVFMVGLSGAPHVSDTHDILERNCVYSGDNNHNRVFSL